MIIVLAFVVYFCTFTFVLHEFPTDCMNDFYDNLGERKTEAHVIHWTETSRR